MEVGIPKSHEVVAMFDLDPVGQVLLRRDGPSHYFEYADTRTPLFYEPDYYYDRGGAEGHLWAKVIGGHVVFRVIDSAEDGDTIKAKLFYIIDGVMGPVFEHPEIDVVPVSEGEHLWYRIANEGKQYLYLDGAVSPPHDKIWPPHFNEGQVAYTFEDDKSQHLWLDGQVGSAYDIVYSPDFEDGHVWYQAAKGDKLLWNFDGVESPHWWEIGGNGYSPGHFWYFAKDDNGWHCVIDGQLSGTIEEPGMFDTVQFLGDRYCYPAKIFGKIWVCTNEWSAKVSGDLTQLGFYGENIAYASQEKDRDRIFVEGYALRNSEFTPKTLWLEEHDGKLVYGGKVRMVYHG